MSILKLITVLLVLRLSIVLAYDRAKCVKPPASCQRGTHEKYYEHMPTNCQQECWGGSCPCDDPIPTAGSYCETGYARLNTSDDCPGQCVPMTPAECINLSKLGDLCRREGLCPP